MTYNSVDDRMVNSAMANASIPYRRVVLDPKRKRFHNKVASVMTIATLVLLLTLSALFGNHESYGVSNANQEDGFDRWLEDNDGNDDGGDNGGDDSGNMCTDDVFSGCSCRYIYEKTPDPGSSQCQFAKTCNGGEGIMSSWVFCSSRMNVFTIFLIITPFLLIWMITLFRLLGSTAEDFFSPSLEMFSVKLGLPPRFAGVSLLALGNGAADVSATMSAIVNDQEDGYKLALGALTGAAMLVGGVIAGVVVLVAGGVPCRGALVRDVAALVITVIAVWVELAKGEITPSSITLFFSLYVLFVCIVLIADVYHRAVVLPRMGVVADDQELARQVAAEQQVNEAAGVNGASQLSTIDSNGTPTVRAAAPTPASSAPSKISRVITAISNYDNPSEGDPAGPSTDGWGVDSAQLEQDRPIVLRGQHGILGHNNAHKPTPDPSSPARDESGSYTLVEDRIDQMCLAPNTMSFSASNWSGAWEDGKRELREHAVQVWEDIYFDADVGLLDKFLLTVELPFVIVRKMTVPIPCEGYYNRALIALSMIVSPLWFAYYLADGHGINLLSKSLVSYFLGFWAIMIAIAACILRFAPGGEGEMSLTVATPIALYGFCIAATWIDFIADHLVALLDFMGIVLHIPGTIMGLTILAWGNSMGDLSANLTMARKGLANMAMTACFAGPVFNILIGLGLGFSTLAATTGEPEKAVALSPSVLVGIIFILVNSASILITGSVFGKGRIETYYGYIALTLYTIYVASSIGLQFSKYGDS